jgi:transposase
MRVVLDVGCGLDVHKRTVTACLLKRGARGKITREARTFITTTADLLALADWLTENHCQHVAMESTGVYWKPVYNLLEGVCQQVLVVNAAHIKNVPGRKTDVKDAEWIADLLVHGLLSGSFVPPRATRELRELTRYRKRLIQSRADESNRIQKLLEGGNIKLASVATDVLGASGRAMLEALVAGETDASQMAQLAKGRLRKKIPELQQALCGLLSQTQRWLLGEQLEQIHQLDQAITRLDAKIEVLLRPFGDTIDRLQEIPGVSRRVAEVLLAEVGTDMKQFPSARHLASWAGMCPGQRESAGKRQSGRTRKGDPWLRATLVEAAWAASRTKQTYLGARYRNLARRRGTKRACMAVGHSILKIAYHLLANSEVRYVDLGDHYLDLYQRDRLKHDLIRRLNSLGVKVTIEEEAA